MYLYSYVSQVALYTRGFSLKKQNFVCKHTHRNAGEVSYTGSTSFVTKVLLWKAMSSVQGRVAYARKSRKPQPNEQSCCVLTLEFPMMKAVSLSYVDHRRLRSIIVFVLAVWLLCTLEFPMMKAVMSITGACVRSQSLSWQCEVPVDWFVWLGFPRFPSVGNPSQGSWRLLYFGHLYLWAGVTICRLWEEKSILSSHIHVLV